MPKCAECGLFSPTEQKCAWFKKLLTIEEKAKSDSCFYYIEISYEDGLPLTTHQHLLLKQEDITSKKMKMK